MVGIDDVAFHVEKLINPRHRCICPLIYRSYPAYHRKRPDKNVDIHKKICDFTYRKLVVHVLLSANQKNDYIQQTDHEKNNRKEICFRFCQIQSFVLIIFNFYAVIFFNILFPRKEFHHAYSGKTILNKS